MLFFELYRQMDIRMFQTMSAIDPTYGSCAKYVLDRDSLILLGMDHSVRLDILSQGVLKDNPIKNWDIESEAVLWFAEDSTEAAIIRLINDAYRKWLSIDANITREYFANELTVINGYLAGYDLKIYEDNTGMSVFRDGIPMTFEQAIELIMDVDENRMDASGIEALINEAFFYRNMDKYEEAAKRLEKVARYVDHTLPIYTNTMFSLAETYYYMGNYERAVMLYYRVNMDYIADKEDFYMHLGHALLDEKMKRYDRHLRIYYHSKIDPQYADTHRQAVAAAQGAVSEVFAEYEATCLDMGRKKYEEYRKSLPKNADDIDELLEIYEKPEERPDIEHKQYSGIKLIEPSAVTDNMNRSEKELLSDALELFLDGEYQEAFEIYYRLKQQVDPDSDQYTWIHFQLGKLYCFFDEPDKAVDALERCNPMRFGLVYRQEDYFLLDRHAHIVRDDFESDIRYRKLVRGIMDGYFAKYDREYNLLIKDRKLIKAFRQYERDCVEEAKYSLKEYGYDTSYKEGGLFRGLFGKKRRRE